MVCDLHQYGTGRIKMCSLKNPGEKPNSLQAAIGKGNNIPLNELTFLKSKQ